MKKKNILIVGIFFSLFSAHCTSELHESIETEAHGAPNPFDELDIFDTQDEVVVPLTRSALYKEKIKSASERLAVRLFLKIFYLMEMGAYSYEQVCEYLTSLKNKFKENL